MWAFAVVLGAAVQYEGLAVVRDGGRGRGVVWRACGRGVDGRTVVAGATLRVVIGARGRGVVLGLVGFGLGMAVVEGFLLITNSVEQIKQIIKKTSRTNTFSHKNCYCQKLIQVCRAARFGQNFVIIIVK